ncbi:hypothetical protein MTO96_047194 [Rhipicephalus appendiculatus]
MAKRLSNTTTVINAARCTGSRSTFVTSAVDWATVWMLAKIQRTTCPGAAAQGNPDPNHQCTPKMSLMRRGTPQSGQALSSKVQDPVYRQETKMGNKESGSRSRTPVGQETRRRATPHPAQVKVPIQRPGQLQFDDDNRGPWFPPAELVEEQRPQYDPGTGRLGSRSSRRHQNTQEDPALPELVSWADKVKGAPKRGVSGETASEP